MQHSEPNAVIEKPSFKHKVRQRYVLLASIEVDKGLPGHGEVEIYHITN